MATEPSLIEYNVGPGSNADQQRKAFEERQRSRRELEEYDLENRCFCGQYIGSVEGVPAWNYCPRCGEDQMHVPNH